MRFLQQYAEIIVSICVVLTLAFGGALYYILSSNHETLYRQATGESVPAATPAASPASENGTSAPVTPESKE